MVEPPLKVLELLLDKLRQFFAKHKNDDGVVSVVEVDLVQAGEAEEVALDGEEAILEGEGEALAVVGLQQTPPLVLLVLMALVGSNFLCARQHVLSR